MKNIMIIDDEELVLQVTKAMLTRGGFQTVTMHQPTQALQVLKDRNDIDLVLLDLVMPEMPGTSVFQEIQKLKPGLPVIVCSGHDTARCFGPQDDPKPVGFLHKPFDIQTLLSVVTEALRMQQQQGRIKLFDLQCFAPLLTRIKKSVPGYEETITPLLTELAQTAYNKGWSDSRRRRKGRG